MYDKGFLVCPSFYQEPFDKVCHSHTQLPPRTTVHEPILARKYTKVYFCIKEIGVIHVDNPENANARDKGQDAKSLKDSMCKDQVCGTRPDAEPQSPPTLPTLRVPNPTSPSRKRKHSARPKRTTESGSSNSSPLQSIQRSS